MRGFYVALVAVQLIGLFYLNCVQSLCTSPVTCQNYGLFNNTTCACECFLPYSGVKCEFANCTNQPVECGSSLVKSQCTDPLIKTYCPGMCQADICQCGFNTCENQGTFNNNTCACSCFQTFSGKRCDTLRCDISDPAECANYGSLCYLDLIKAYCPHKCNRCPTCTQTLNCTNSGLFDNSTCKCQCFGGYSGQLCENLDCTASEPSACSTLSCSSSMVKDYCFKTCGKCPSTTPATTTKCPQTLTCLNSGSLNPSTCLCQCFAGYKGSQCETLNCTVGDPPNCATSFKTTDCSLQVIKDYCPNMCGKCSSSTSTVTSTATSTVSSTVTSTQTITSVTSVSSATSAITSTSTIVSDTSTGTTVSVTTTCAPVSNSSCMNGGSVISDPCKCDCFPNFSGINCQTLMCVQDQTGCELLTADMCPTDPTLPFLCPFLCGLCSTSTAAATSTISSGSTDTTPSSGSTDSTITSPSSSSSQTNTSPVTNPSQISSDISSITSSASTGLTSCAPISSCLNGGALTTDKCSCQCAPFYSGKQCELLTCNSDQPSCTSLTTSMCNNNIIIDACPFLCGICTTPGQVVNFLNLPTTTSVSTTTVTTPCVPIACKNGVVFDPASCSCPCPAGYLAPDCGTYNCAVNIPDPQPDCAAPVDCSIFALNCPRTCNCP